MSAHPDLSKEEDTRQSALVAKISRWSHICDSYAPETFDERLVEWKNALPTLSDPFYADAARHALINALCKARRVDEAAIFYAAFENDFIAEKSIEDNAALAQHPHVATLLNFRRLSKQLNDVRDRIALVSERIPEDPFEWSRKLDVLSAGIDEKLKLITEAVQKITTKTTRLYWLAIALLILVIFNIHF